jgi:hypothetical protein
MRRILTALALVVCCIGASSAAAQEAPTATPAQVDLSNAAAQQPQPANAPTATRTPTEAPPARLEPLESANVRAEPSTSAAILGQIRAGEVYNVTGRYFEWYQFQYPQSPNARGWVFGQLVNIIGDPAAIPEIDLSAQATVDPLILGATQTLEAITQTPGGLLTATVNARLIAAPPGAGAELPGGSGEITGTPQPTYTYPPGVVRLPTQPAGAVPDTAFESTASSVANGGGGLPPLVPIMVLGGIGVLGLAISSVRRW